MSAFEMHRAGEYAHGRAKHTRRCISADEMRAKGMGRTANGAWNTGRVFPGAEKLTA